MKIVYSIIIIFIFGSNAYAMDKYYGAPNKITDWKISCGVDKGSLIDNYPSYIFKTSKNYCSGGTYNQRAEIYTRKAITLSTKVKYNFQSTFSIIDKMVYGFKFNIFQIHDGRDGCRPPLEVIVQPNGQLRLRSTYKTGPGESCENEVMKSTGFGPTKIIRDGTEYKLNVLLDFNGQAGFKVDVFLNDKLEVSGKYEPPVGKKYKYSKHYYFKHGVYSKEIFDYEMKSKISMKKVG